jgi:FMNH2-dependent dimethyl sulfone monooxygenase
MELSRLFAWNVRSRTHGIERRSATDPDRLQDFWGVGAVDLACFREAERIGLDSEVQYGMWTGYGGPSRRNNAGYDFASAAAACAAITDRLGIFSTCHGGVQVSSDARGEDRCLD